MLGPAKGGNVGLPERRLSVLSLVVKAGQSLDEAAVIEHCRTSLARFKVPQKVVFVESLPKNPSGKLFKRELRRQSKDLITLYKSRMRVLHTMLRVNDLQQALLAFVGYGDEKSTAVLELTHNWDTKSLLAIRRGAGTSCEQFADCLQQILSGAGLDQITVAACIPRSLAVLVAGVPGKHEDGRVTSQGVRPERSCQVKS